MVEWLKNRAAKPAVLSISSHVIRGAVGNRAAVFALEALGFPVWSVPTITLPWHPGHGPATRLMPEREVFARLLEDIGNAPWIGEIGGILTGYMASAEQVECVGALISKLKRHNPDILYLCDPVIGDKGGLYVAEETAIAIRDHLLPLADFVTPNRYELAWLVGETVPDTIEQAIGMARSFGPAGVLVTSAPGEQLEELGNLYCDDQTSLLALHGVCQNPPNGPGDLTSALFLAHKLEGLEKSDCLERTTASVLEVLQHSLETGNNELALECCAESLRQPRAKITVAGIRN